MMPRPAQGVPQRDPRVSDAIEALQNGDDALRGEDRFGRAFAEFERAAFIVQALMQPPTEKHTVALSDIVSRWLKECDYSEQHIRNYTFKVVGDEGFRPEIAVTVAEVRALLAVVKLPKYGGR